MGSDRKVRHDLADEFAAATAHSWVLANLLFGIINKVLKSTAPDELDATPVALVCASNDNRCPSSSDEKSIGLDETDTSAPISRDRR